MSDTPRDGAPLIGPLAVRAPEAAKLLAISPRALWSATKSGAIPHRRVGRTVIYSVDQLRNWLTGKGAAK